MRGLFLLQIVPLRLRSIWLLMYRSIFGACGIAYSWEKPERFHIFFI